MTTLALFASWFIAGLALALAFNITQRIIDSPSDGFRGMLRKVADKQVPMPEGYEPVYKPEDYDPSAEPKPKPKSKAKAKADATAKKTVADTPHFKVADQEK